MNPMLDDNSKVAALIVGKPGVGEIKQEVKKDNELGLDVAADEVMSAVKEGNKEALKSALKTFVMLCEDQYKEDED